MPWLWDFPDPSQSRDWFYTYRELRLHCFATTPEIVDGEVIGESDQSLVMELANRRRVWKACGQLAKVYLDEEREMGAGGETGDVGEGVSLQMPLVASPLEGNTQALQKHFLTSWEDVGKETRLWFYFEDAGRLCGVQMKFVGGGEKKLFGEQSEEVVEAVVPEGSWIEGLEFNIRNADNLEKKAKLGISGLKVCYGQPIQFTYSGIPYRF